MSMSLDSRRISKLEARRLSRRPSFILVDDDEQEEINCFTVFGNMGIPILYIAATATILVGVICMGVITKYWSNLTPPQCFLYSTTASQDIFYKFGSNLSSCYFVAYGAIPVLIIVVVCGIMYVFHVKDDKDIDTISMICIAAMFVATILMLIVVCTFTQGMRITCATISLNPSNNRGYTCLEKLDRRVEQFNLPIKTSSMVTAALGTMWAGTTCLLLISIFHIAMFVRRRSFRDY